MSSRDAILAFIAVLLLAALLGCAGTATKESTGEYIDDTVITAKVKTAIFNEPTLNSVEVASRKANPPCSTPLPS